MRQVFFLLISCSCISPDSYVSCSNWAQVSGPKQQNMAAVPTTMFEPRYGLGAVSLLENRAMPCMTEEQLALRDSGESSSRLDSTQGDQFIMVLGGDTYVGSTGQKEGSYINDVWSFRGELKSFADPNPSIMNPSRIHHHLSFIYPSFIQRCRILVNN
jgi:hypothetical protein